MTSWTPKQGRKTVDVFDPEDVNRYLEFCVQENRIDFAVRDVLEVFYAKQAAECLGHIHAEIKALVYRINQEMNRK